MRCASSKDTPAAPSRVISAHAFSVAVTHILIESSMNSLVYRLSAAGAAP